MLFNTLRRAALAAVAVSVALVPSARADDDEDETPNGQSTFLAPDDNLAFALTVPDHGNEDIYFSLRVPTRLSWGAVGLGSDDMPGALYLMIYQNEDGNNVTFSPRLAYGNYEPKYYEDMEYEILNGTGIFDDHMVFVAKCTSHCRSWPSGGTSRGYIDVSSATQKAIYAVGPEQGFHSDDPAEGIRYHQAYGSFTIDMKRTRGSSDAPILDEESEAVGTTMEWGKSGKSNWKSTVHAVFMVLAFAALMPIGVVLLNLGVQASWHGINQSVAVVFVVIGFSMGILTSFKYQRSRGFDAYHQVLGMIIVAVVLGQFCLGFLNHMHYKKTQQPAKYTPIHRWVGRAILFFGIVNAFFGFKFALNRKYGMVLAGLVILLVFSGILVILLRRHFDNKRRKGPLGNAPAHQPEPWRNGGTAQNAGYPSDPPPGYEATASSSSNIDLRPVSPSPWRRNSTDNKAYEDGANLGTAHRPREFA